MIANLVGVDTSISELRAILPGIEALLKQVGYPSVARILASLPNAGSMTFANLARAAGLTELEIRLLIEDLNDRISYPSPGNAKKGRRKAA